MISPDILQQCLNESFCQETSLAGKFYNPDNPAYAHSGVASLVARDFCGGKIVDVAIPFEWVDRCQVLSQCVNALPGNKIIDFTKQQFPEGFPHQEAIVEAAQDNWMIRDMARELREDPDVFPRYLLLKERVLAALAKRTEAGLVLPSNPIDKILRRILPDFCPRPRFTFKQ